MHSKLKLNRHLELHKFLHQKLELLVADFQDNYSSRNIDNISISELIRWSAMQKHHKTIAHIEPIKGGE